MKAKRILISGLIILMIFLVSVFNYYNLFLLPILNENKIDKKVLDVFKNNNNLSDINFVSRYTFDNTYYSGSDDEYLYLFTKNGNLIVKEKLSEIDLEKIKSIIEKNYSINKYELVFSIFEEKLVYVVVSEDYDYGFSIDDFSEVFKFKKGIDNE